MNETTNPDSDGFDQRKAFVDWVKNSDVVQLGDFTRDGFQTVYLTTNLTPGIPNEVVKRATDAGYTYRWKDQQGRLVFSTDGDDPRTQHLKERLA